MFLPPTMRWYSFWDDSSQFHHLPSVTTILDVTIAPARRSRLTQALAWPYQYPHLPITALATLHVTPYSLKENLILDPDAIAQLQHQFLKRLRGFGAAYGGSRE